MPSKRVQSKKSGHRLRMLADQAWQYWTLGFLARDVEFANTDEERQCWQLVRAEYQEEYPPGKVDKFGFVEYGCYGFWRWDTPGDVDFRQIEGLPDDFATRYQKLQYLKSWGMVPEDTRDEGLVKRATEIATYCHRGSYPHPTGVSDEEKKRTWQGVEAEYKAWCELGYVEENDGTGI